MATAEEALVALLTGGSPPLVARLYPDVLLQGTGYPAVRYARVSTARSEYRTLDGRSNYARPRFQIDVYALKRSEAVALAQQIVRSLDGYAGVAASLRIDGTAMDDEAGDFESEAALYRQRIELLMFHPE